MLFVRYIRVFHSKVHFILLSQKQRRGDGATFPARCTHDLREGCKGSPRISFATDVCPINYFFFFFGFMTRNICTGLYRSESRVFHAYANRSARTMLAFSRLNKLPRDER